MHVCDGRLSTVELGRLNMPTDTKATLLCFVVSWQVLLGVNNDEALVGLAVAVQSMHARSAALLQRRRCAMALNSSGVGGVP
jgi:hypothetical protein